MRENSSFDRQFKIDDSADEFVELIGELLNNLNLDYTDRLQGDNYPIGLLGCRYHIHFMHYKTYHKRLLNGMKDTNELRQFVRYSCSDSFMYKGRSAIIYTSSVSQ